MSAPEALVVDWAAGPHHGIAWPGGLALVDGSVPHEVVRDVWTAMLAPGAGLPVLLAALGEGPHFGAAIDSDDGTSHLVSRGDVGVTATAEEGEVFVSGAGSPGLEERRVRGLRRVALRSGTTASGSMRPLGSGVVPAGAIERVDAARAHPAPVALAGAGEVVTAVLCPAGHANPPQRTTCRVCADPVASAPRTVPRPPLGIARLSTGADLSLTGPIVVGRDPRAARFQGTEVPQLVRLPHKHVSASHLELRVSGWHVLASDLHSTNGTYLRRGGEPPARLSETPVALRAEDVLDLGHGVHVRFLELP